MEVGCDVSDTRGQNRKMEMEKEGEATREKQTTERLIEQEKSNKKPPQQKQ
jgi:hypothetical protein